MAAKAPPALLVNEFLKKCPVARFGEGIAGSITCLQQTGFEQACLGGPAQVAVYEPTITTDLSSPGLLQRLLPSWQFLHHPRQSLQLQQPLKTKASLFIQPAIFPLKMFNIRGCTPSLYALANNVFDNCRNTERFWNFSW